MAIRQASKCKPCARSVFALFLVATGSMFIAGLLFLALILIGNTRLVTIGQGVEGFDAPAFGHPFLLSGDRPLFGMGPGRVGLLDGLIQFAEKAGVVLPFAGTQPGLSRSDETRPVFLAVLHQQIVPLRGFLFARDQFAEFSPGFIKAQLRQVEQGLERESASHGGRSLFQPEPEIRAGKARRISKRSFYAALNNWASL